MRYSDLNMDLSEAEVALKTNANKFARGVMRPISIQLDRMTPEEAIAPQSPFWDFTRKAYQLGYHKLPFPEVLGCLRNTWWKSSSGMAGKPSSAMAPTIYSSLLEDTRSLEPIREVLDLKKSVVTATASTLLHSLTY